MASIKSALGATGGSGGVALGATVLFPGQSPTVIEQSGVKYIREGFFETVDYDPALEQIADQTMGVGASLYYGEVASTSYTNGADNDGANLWISHISNVGFFRSTDDGATWTDITAATSLSASSLVKIKWISGTGNTSVWLMQNAVGLRRSTNGGQTWASVATGVASAYPAIAANGNTVLINSGTAGLVRRSTDGGATFGSNISLSGSDKLSTDIIYTQGNIFVVSGSTNFSTSPGPTFWVSDDNGLTFGSPMQPISFISGATQGMAYAPLYNRIYVAVGGALRAITTFSKTAMTASPTILATLYAPTDVFVPAAVKANGLLWASLGNQGIVQFIEQNDATFPIRQVCNVTSFGASGGVVLSNSAMTKFFNVRTSRLAFVCKKGLGLYVASNASTATTSNPTNVAAYMRIK